MGVLTSEVGYTIATTRRETTKVHKNMWWNWKKEIIKCVKHENIDCENKMAGKQR